jgi:hypothetical protein
MGLIDYAGLLRRGSWAQSLGESGLSRGTHKVLTEEEKAEIFARVDGEFRGRACRRVQLIGLAAMVLSVVLAIGGIRYLKAHSVAIGARVMGVTVNRVVDKASTGETGNEDIAILPSNTLSDGRVVESYWISGILHEIDDNNAVKNNGDRFLKESFSVGGALRQIDLKIAYDANSATYTLKKATVSGEFGVADLGISEVTLSLGGLKTDSKYLLNDSPVDVLSDGTATAVLKLDNYGLSSGQKFTLYRVDGTKKVRTLRFIIPAIGKRG